MSENRNILYRELDHLHRLLREQAGSQSTINPVYGDSPNLPDIYYVDSGNGSDGNDGRDPQAPLATIDAAINKCAASQGDVILVQPGHSESLSAAIELDVIGVSIIGVGEGTLRPQITLAANDNGIEISAANCRVENLYFNERTVVPTGDAAYIDLAAANAVVKNCHFDCGANDLDSITVAAGGDSCIVDGCTFAVTADGPESAIRIEAVGVDKLNVKDCHFDGNSVANSWDTGIILSTVAHTRCLIERNTFHFMAANIGGIEFTAAATGLIHNNAFGGGTLGQMLDPGSCMCVQNFEQDAIDESGRLFPDINPDGSVGGGAHGGINDLTTDSLHGKLGTDTEMADHSLWDLIEGTGVVGAPTPTVHGANVNLADMIAWIIEGTRRGTGTTLPADLSLYDLIGGAKGHSAWPTAIPYANDVSLMEVVGYIQDQIRPPAGAHIPGYGIHITKAANVQAVTDDIFDVTGLVMVNLLFCEVTAAFDATIGNLSFRIKTSNEPLCTATAVTSDPVKTLYLLSGDVADALNGGVTPTPNVAGTPNKAPFIIGNNGGAEVIEMLLSAADAATGAMTVHIYYTPLEAGAAIAASA